MARDIHVGTVGLAFRPTIKDEDDEIVDISAATSLVMVFEKPSLTDGGDPESVSFEADFYTDGTDGTVQYVTAPGDLDRPGRWRAQAFAYFGEGNPLPSDIVKFRVKANLTEDI